MAKFDEVQVTGNNGETVAEVGTNNSAAAAGLFVLPGRATAAAPTLDEGKIGYLSFDLSGNLRVSGGAGGTSMTEGAVFSLGATSGTPFLALFDDVAPTAPTEGRAHIPRISAERSLYIEIRDAGGNERGANVDGSGNLQVVVGAALPAGTNNIGDVDVASVPAPLSTTGGGSEATALRVTVANDSTGVLSVDDNGGSLTIDNATLSVTGGGTEASALRVTLANDSSGVVSVDDNGGSLTVDGTVFVAGLVDTELTTADLDTGVGTDTRAVVGLVLAASGGGLLVGSANPMPVSDNGSSLTIDNATLAVVGGGTEATALRVTLANDSSGVLSVDDNGGSLTIDNATLSVVGGGTEATALRVTVASDSTGVLSVDDNGGSLTVDGTVAVSSITTSVTPGTAAGHLGKAEDAQHSSGDTGVYILAVRDDSLSSHSGTDGDYESLHTDAVGNLRVTNDASATNEGTDTLRDTSITNSDEALKASAGSLYGFEAHNPNTVDAYIQFYDASTASVSVGVTTPKLSFIIPAGAGTDRRGATSHKFDPPIKFGTAITYAATTGFDNGTAPGTALTGLFFYK